MKKEVVIAILIGLFLGLFITYGIYQARTGVSRRSRDAELTLAPSPADQLAGELILNSPLDETIQNDTSLTVSGTTLSNSFVVIMVNEDEIITTSDDSGNFSVEVELAEGGNIITVIVVNTDGRTTSVERAVIVSDEVFEEATQSATPQ